ncbi:MAG: ExsB family transcriptional regulator [Candidatus Diapherotrites archaeon]|nr:ExsB family transcriptional regulator [Candidatus Diapherotrites archaeon]
MSRLKRLKEIPLEKLNAKKFILEKTKEIQAKVGAEKAICALSGGVDSAVVAMLGHKAIGNRMKTYFVDSGLMRDGEKEEVIETFKQLGIHVNTIQASKIFFNRLKGIKDPEKKREAITFAFYRDVFPKIMKREGTKFLLHGTNYTDIEETVKGIKRQHNILSQIGLNTIKEFGCIVLEPLAELRKPAIRVIAKELGLPKEIYERVPFPGPALAARVIGEVTLQKIAVVRKATKIVEEELRETNAFQYLAILHEDKITGIKENKRVFGNQIEVRCWESEDASKARPTELSYQKLARIAQRITNEIPSVVSVTYNISKKPPSTIEAV